jgi:hypothetical protein
VELPTKGSRDVVKSPEERRLQEISRTPDGSLELSGVRPLRHSPPVGVDKGLKGKMGVTKSVSTVVKDQEGTMTPLAPKDRQNPDCLTPVVILSPVVRGNKLVERKGNVAIYQGPYQDFEVIVIRVAEESVFGGKVVPRREVYPSAEVWGTYGWTFSPNSHPDPLKAAREKMKQLTRRAK